MIQNIGRLVLKSGNVFDSIKGKILENKTIVIEGRKISWLGEEGSFEKDKNDKIIDVSEKFLIPGMIECHVHLDCTGTAQTERELYRTKTAMYPYIALNNAQKHLMSGFTCVRDCGSYPDWAPSLRRIFDQGIIAGPRLVVSDRFLGQPGTEELVFPDMYLDYLKKYYNTFTGIDGVKHAVRERKSFGSDFIKTATTGGVLHGIESKLDKSFWMDEELTAIREEAHRLDMHIAVHAHGREGIYRAVKAGFDTIEHGSFLDEETANLMIKKGIYLIPTQTALYNLTNSNIYQQMPPEVQVKIKETSSISKENHKMAFEKGVPIAIGTDAGTPGNFHGNTGKEVRFMVENVGMTPTQALQTATIEGAKAIKMEEKIGSLEQGKIADIIICNKNPLENIALLEEQKNFSHIIKDGIIMVEKGKIIHFS